MPHHVLQQQHATLSGLGARILEALAGAESDAGLRELRVAVARFRGALLVHQRMENEALYPHLMAHADPSIASAARALYGDLGDIYDQFMHLETNFGSLEAVSGNLLEYGMALKRVLKRLSARMKREDAELYPLAERANLTTLEPAPSAPDDDLSVEGEHARWQRGFSR